MRKFLCVLLVLGCANMAALRADDASHRKAALETLEAMKMKETLSNSIDQILDLQIKQNPMMAQFRKVMKDFFAKYLSYESLKPEMVKLYMSEFTETELREMTAFFKTPTGQKMMSKQAILASKGMELGMKRVQENQAELQRNIEAELKKNKN